MRCASIGFFILLLALPLAAAEPAEPDEDTSPPTVKARGQESSLPKRVGLALLLGGAAGLPLALPPVRYALLVALFSRLRRNDLLLSESRGRIMELLRGNPGLGIKDVTERLQLGWGTAVHHLLRLEKAGLVTSQDSGRRRRFFVAGTSPTVRTALCVLTGDSTRRLLEFVRANPGATQTQAVQALGFSAPLVHKYARRLETEGLLRVERRWRAVQYYAAADATSHLEEYLRLTGPPEAEGLGAPAADA